MFRRLSYDEDCDVDHKRPARGRAGSPKSKKLSHQRRAGPSPARSYVDVAVEPIPTPSPTFPIESRPPMNPTLDYAPAPTKSVTVTMILLSIMMFLEFFVWGAWYVTMSTFMTEAKMTDKIGLAYMLCPIAAIISPFFLGMIADRFFSSEKVLAVLMIVGGAAMFLVPNAARQGTGAFLGVILIHAMCYMPTLGLTNTIAFANMTNQEKQFPLVRVFGTLGWIVAGLMISFMGVDKLATPFLLAGGAAVLMGLFSFALPHTPPPAKGKKVTAGDILGKDALALFRSPSFVIFAIASFLICIPLAAYYSFAGANDHRLRANHPPAGRASGQAGRGDLHAPHAPLLRQTRREMDARCRDVLVGRALRRSFAMGAPDARSSWMIVDRHRLHGMCYDFFFVTGFIYTDKKADKEIRGQAQGLLVLITQGLGLGIGAYLTGEHFNRTVRRAPARLAALSLYPKFWWVWSIFALVVLIFSSSSSSATIRKHPAGEHLGFDSQTAVQGEPQRYEDRPVSGGEWEKWRCCLSPRRVALSSTLHQLSAAASLQP